MDDDWGARLDDLERRRAAVHAMGGAERVGRQHGAGKLTARERIEAFFDRGSFCELGALAGEPGVPADALVAGAGLVAGQPLLAGAEDFTVLGGSIGIAAADKRYRLCQLAGERRLPLVMMLDGAGHRAGPPAGRRPNDLQGLADLAGLVPTVALVLGPSAGHGALTVPLCDFSVMTQGAALFSAGPPLVRAAVGEDVTPAELGGPDVHATVSGVVHNVVADDHAALALARRYLSYFAVRTDRHGSDRDRRDLDAIIDLVPADDRRPYPMRKVVALVCDRDSVLEIQPGFGAAIVCALARLGGTAIAVVANDPSVKAGTIDAAAAVKAAQFLTVAGNFDLPVVFLADNPGVMAGTRAEREGTLRHVAALFRAQRRITAPKLHVTMRKAYGFGSSVMAMNPFDHQALTLALAGATLAARPAGESAGDEPRPGPYRAAASLAYDDVIDPRQLRNALLTGLRLFGAGQA